MDIQLVNACENGNIKRVKDLIVQGANIHTYGDCHIGDPLYCATKYGHLEIVKYLIKKGVNIHAVDDWILRNASENGHLDIVKYSIEQGANIHTYDDYALLVASENGHLDVVKLLIEQGANIHADNEYALRIASENEHFDIIKYVIPYYNYTGLITISFNLGINELKMLRQYEKMKCYVLLLYRIHNQKIPLELQKIIFNFI